MHNSYYSTHMTENTWIIHEPIEGGIPASYLLVGDHKGILIDSTCGNENLKAYVQTLTDKPVNEVICTRGHPDHTGGNRWFNTAYMTQMTEQSMRVFYSKLSFDHIDDSTVVYIKPGDVIDLGNRQLEIFSLEGHDFGSICILDKKERILFTGDNIGNDSKEMRAPGGMLWYKGTRTQPSLYMFMLDLAKIMARRDEIEYVCWGHNEDQMLPASILDHYMIAVLEALNGAQDNKPRADDPRFPYRFYDYFRAAYYKDAAVVYDIRYAFATEKGEPTVNM